MRLFFIVEEFDGFLDILFNLGVQVDEHWPQDELAFGDEGVGWVILGVGGHDPVDEGGCLGVGLELGDIVLVGSLGGEDPGDGVLGGGVDGFEMMEVLLFGEEVAPVGLVEDAVLIHLH